VTEHSSRGGRLCDTEGTMSGPTPSRSLSHETASITLPAAQAAAEAAISEAGRLGMAIVVCVLDGAGRIKVWCTMDGAPPLAQSAALKKAQTALGFGMPTGDAWYQFIKDDPILFHGVPSLPEFTLLGGGAPVAARLPGGSTATIGAIGISGGHYKQDEACLKAALGCLANDFTGGTKGDRT
jgi:uncharacterized protein GlcG (DUF336 family)